MTPECAAIVAAWLDKAKSDLASARILIEGAQPHLDTGCYHCQQTAEKALKGWLTLCGIEFRKTHDLQVLLAQCSVVYSPFETLRQPAIFLLPFATQFRYPGDVFEPPLDEAREAVRCATVIMDFVIATIKTRHPDLLKGSD